MTLPIINGAGDPDSLASDYEAGVHTPHSKVVALPEVVQENLQSSADSLSEVTDRLGDLANCISTVGEVEEVSFLRVHDEDAVVQLSDLANCVNGEESLLRVRDSSAVDRLDTLHADLVTPYVDMLPDTQSGLGSWTGYWMDLRKFSMVHLHMAWSAVTNTSGTLTLEATVDSAQGEALVNNPALAANVVDVTSVFSTHYGSSLSVGATAGATIVPVQNPPPFMRWKYTRVAGGDVDQFKPMTFGRI